MLSACRMTGLKTEMQDFPQINRAYERTFKPDNLTIGLVVPLEAHGHNPVPTMERHLERVSLADELGFAT